MSSRNSSATTALLPRSLNTPHQTLTGEKPVFQTTQSTIGQLTAHPTPDAQTGYPTNASATAVAAALQQLTPTTLFSRPLQEPDTRYYTHIRDQLAVTIAIQRFIHLMLASGSTACSQPPPIIQHFNLLKNPASQFLSRSSNQQHHHQSEVPAEKCIITQSVEGLSFSITMGRLW